MISTVFITDGRGEYLQQCLASYHARVSGDVGEHIVVSDAGNALYNGWLRDTVPDGWQVIDHPVRLGLVQAVRTAWEATTGDYVFHVEEDFTFDRAIDLDIICSVLETHPSLAQMVLTRQPWSPEEIKAGSIAALDRDAYHQTGRFYWNTTKLFSLNPCVIPRVIIDKGFPDGDEAAFAKQLCADGWYLANWGNLDDPPWVTHIGERRSAGWSL